MWEVRGRKELWIILRFPGEQVSVSILNRDGHFFLRQVWGHKRELE